VKNRFYVHANASGVRSTQWCIAITQAAFEAIARSLPLGNVSFENKTEGSTQPLLTGAIVFGALSNHDSAPKA
jgi:hypothetical protein